jgi:hypothetical protein
VVGCRRDPCDTTPPGANRDGTRGRDPTDIDLDRMGVRNGLQTATMKECTEMA